MRWIEVFFTPLAIPVLAIVGGILAMVMRHRERMAMIERGMNPDLESDVKGKLSANAGAQGYQNPAQNQSGSSPLNRR